MVQEHREAADITTITETDQLTMSTEIPDDWLRKWLNAKAVLVKEDPDTVGAEHPLVSLDEPDQLRENPGLHQG